MSRLFVGAATIVATALSFGVCLGPRAPAYAEPRFPDMSPTAAEQVARDAATRLGYPAVLGVACATVPGEPHARCQVRVHEEPATHNPDERDVVLLQWQCAAGGCWQAP